jgi:hypothetical protein
MRLIPAVLLLAIVVSSCAQNLGTSAEVPVSEPTPSAVANKTLTPDWAREPAKDCKPVRGWCPGTYRGLTAGQSTFADMVEILGQQTSSGPAADQDDPKYYIWHDYGKISNGIIGRLAIVTDTRTNKIDYISIAPDEMKKQQAIDLFGPDFQETGYTFCRGFDDDTSAPIYEDSNSSEIRYVEYRSRGIYFPIGFRDVVNEIIFASEPLGLASKKECKAMAKAK